METDQASENDFLLLAPNKFQPGERNLFTTIKFFIGGKTADDCIETDLSKKHVVREVIKHVLTLVRSDPILKMTVKFDCALDEPQ
jgi:hypothetical protein